MDLTALLEMADDYAKIFISILVIINPIGGATIFLGLTADLDARQRASAARRAALGTTVILLVSLVAGNPILRLFAIDINSFRAAGGLLILLTALSMIAARDTAHRQTPEEATEAADKPDIAIVPMAIPLLAGPGAISLVIVSASQYRGFGNAAILAGITIAVGLCAWGALAAAAPIGARLGRTGVNVLTRVMGILLAAVAIEMVVRGLVGLVPALAAH